jgi:hypothetical protein
MGLFNCLSQMEEGFSDVIRMMWDKQREWEDSSECTALT